jgi:hypothetical protein
MSLNGGDVLKLFRHHTNFEMALLLASRLVLVALVLDDQKGRRKLACDAVLQQIVHWTFHRSSHPSIVIIKCLDRGVRLKTQEATFSPIASPSLKLPATRETKKEKEKKNTLDLSFLPLMVYQRNRSSETAAPQVPII